MPCSRWQGFCYCPPGPRDGGVVMEVVGRYAHTSRGERRRTAKGNAMPCRRQWHEAAPPANGEMHAVASRARRANIASPRLASGCRRPAARGSGGRGGGRGCMAPGGSAVGASNQVAGSLARPSLHGEMQPCSRAAAHAGMHGRIKRGPSERASIRGRTPWTVPPHGGQGATSS